MVEITGKELVERAVKSGLIVRPADATVKQQRVCGKGIKKRLEAATQRSRKGSKMNVNFSVFIDKILSGKKRQTIRRASPKWANVKAGDKLTLYTGLRTKQCRKLGEAVVESITQIKLDSGYITIHKPKWDFTLDSWQVQDFVKADGFDSVEDFWDFFKEHYGWEAVEMVVIKWRDFVPQTPPEDWNCTKQQERKAYE